MARELAVDINRIKQEMDLELATKERVSGSNSKVNSRDNQSDFHSMY